MPETFWTLDRLGVLNEMKQIGFTRKNGVQFVQTADDETPPFYFDEHAEHESAVTFHVQRAEFDKLLFDTALKRGATITDETTVVDVEFKKNGSHLVSLKTVDGKTKQVATKIVVDASGQQSLIANRNQLKEVNPHLKKAAIWAYFKNAIVNGGCNPEVTCVLHTKSKEAWFWYVPLSDETVSVGLVGDSDFILKRGGSPQQTFNTEVGNCPGLQRRLRDAQPVGKFYVAKDFSYTTTQASGAGWVLIGDAYGYIDPVFCSGVFLALKSGELAADAIIDSFYRNDFSAESLGRWADKFEDGVQWIRKLVQCFYDKDFSFSEFMQAHPEHAGKLTALFAGKVFEGNPGAIFDDLDPWLENLKGANALT